MTTKGRQAIEMVSALGVVGSLIFVGLEVRQSNVIARQEALQTIISEWNDLAVPWALDARFSAGVVNTAWAFGSFVFGAISRKFFGEPRDSD